ncbi:MAG: hypothetical protein U0K66_03185 [Paludibacteraceae bacterium]|nr:hypothetical protein [Paludibacteraceae bacterium]
MKSLFRYIIFLILLNFSFAAKAESIYPIQLYAAMLPPYTNCLGDYINGDMNRLKLSAVVRDMSKHGSTMSISVLMRVKSGNTVYLETTTPVQQIINVQGAMVDIRTENLFTSYDNNAKNLVGRGSFMSNGYCLPEGAYEFVYQVFDGTNKKLPLSEPISIYCFLNQAEPPVGVTPLDGECLDSKTNQNIVFSWMDAVAIGPKYREYSVEVKEQNGAMLASQEGLLPMFGAQSEVNNFTVVTEKSYNTNTLIMQNTSSKFQEGKTYLWRVRAVPTKVKGKADENFAYKNDGYSEWMSFKYGGCGDSVVIPKADSIDMNLRVDMTTVDTSEETGSVVVHWQDIFDNAEVDKYCAYELYVYKADNESAAKTIIPIKDGETKEYTFDNLERGETYKSYIVGLTGCGTPDTIRTPHSDTVSFKLKKPESDSCMVNIDPAKCGKDDLIETLEKGSTFTANDHNVIVTITECKAGSVAGSFTGKGIVSCTIFKDKIGLNVEFEDILVNKSKELCMGTVKVITSEENNLLINLNDLTGKKRTAPKAPSQDYPYTKKVATLDELKKDVEQYKGEVVLVGDKEIYAVGNDGEIEEVGKIVENACRPSKQSLDNSAGLVVFDVDEKYNDPKWTPYIDKSPSPFSYAQIVNGYERIGSYVVPWVSMVQGEARYIKATIQGKTKTTGTGLSGMEKDIKFYCVTDSVMTELNSEYKDGAFKVKVFGGQPDRKLTIVAMMNSTGTADECAKNSKTIGETNIYTMSYRKKTIHLVPVCMDVTGEMGDPKTYADRINKVFAPLGRSYEFKFEDKFENEEVKSLIANGLNTEDGGNVFNNKTPEMKQLCRLYKHDENVKIDHRADAYVFMLDQNTNADIKGYMPRTNSEGFVFTKGMKEDEIAETMTHELCHGLYGLEHTFTYGVDKNAVPENIMSYSTQIGRTPSKYFQWYNIENPSDYHFPFTDSAEDGEYTTDGHFYLFTYLGLLLGVPYETAFDFGKWSENPDTHVFKDGDISVHVEKQKIDGEEMDVYVVTGYRAGQMYERTTWLIGGLQQRYHALTKGYHGVELATTLYAILKLKNKDLIHDYLLHRFGDCFAHFNIGQGSFPCVDCIGSPKIKDAEAVEKANALYKAMEGNMTNKDVIYDILLDPKLTPADIRLIYKKFGKKEYAQTGSPMTIFGYQVFDSHPYDLINWIDKELDIADGNGPLPLVDQITKLNRLKVVFQEANFDWNKIVNDPDGTYDDKSFSNPSIDSYISSIDKFVEDKNKIEFIQATNGVNPNMIYVYRNKESKKIIKIKTTCSKDYFTYLIVNSVLSAHSMINIIDLDWIYSGILSNLPKSIQNSYVMYGAEDIQGSTTIGHTVDALLFKKKSNPDFINRRSELFKIYASYAADLYKKMAEVGIYSHKQFNDKNQALQKLYKVIDWSKSTGKINARLDGVLAVMIAIERAKQNKVKKVDFLLPVKWLPEEERQAAIEAISQTTKNKVSELTPTVISEGVGEGITWMAESSQAQFNEECDGIRDFMIQFVEDNKEVYGIAELKSLDVKNFARYYTIILK